MAVITNGRGGRARTASAAALAVLAFGLAACGGGGSPSSGSGSGGVDSFGGPVGGKVTAADVAVAQKFVGGTSGKATKSPIYVGLIVPGGGPIPAPPGGRSVVTAAQRFLNEHLGGIDGHPLLFKPCNVGTSDEQALGCGQKFLNDPSIKAVMNPGQPVGGLALLGAIDGKKAEFCTVPTQPELFGTNVFCPGGGIMAAASSITYLERVGGIKTVSQLLPDADLFRQIAESGIHQLKARGFKPTLGLLPQNSPDVTSAVIASGARNADAIDVTLVSPGQCIAVAKALKTLGVTDKTTVVSLPTCINPTVKKALGDLPHWTYFSMGPVPFAKTSDPEVKAYLNAVATYGGGQSGAWSTSEFGTTLFMAKAMNTAGAGTLTPAGIVAAAKRFRGPAFLGAPDTQFGKPPWGNTGTLTGRFYHYDGDGKWTDVTGGKYLPSPPPAN